MMNPEFISGIDPLALLIAQWLGGILTVGTLYSLWESWRLQKAEDEFWNGWILKDGKMNPDYMDQHRSYRFLGNYKGGDK